MDNKPNCYECKYRGSIPGDAHSMCHHPLVKQSSNAFGALVDMMSGGSILARKQLNIHGNSHGIRKGWFYWPANFDPVWLENCDGFLLKTNESNPPQ